MWVFQKIWFLIFVLRADKIDRSEQIWRQRINSSTEKSQLNLKVIATWLYQCRRINGEKHVASVTQDNISYKEDHESKEQPKKELPQELLLTFFHHTDMT